MTIARPRTSGPRQRPPAPRRGRLGVQGGRAAFLATGPTAWYDARDLLTTSQQTLVNRVGTGSATLGSTAGSDTNDPVALTHTGTDYFWFPGSTNNYVHGGNLDLTGDIYLDVTFEVPASRASMEIITDRAGSSAEAALRFNAAGTHLELFWFESAVAKAATSSVAHGFTAGTTVRVVAARDNDGSGGNYLVRFYTGSGIGGALTQLGADVVGAAPAAPTTASAVFKLGGDTVPFLGRAYSAYVYSNFAGTGSPLASYVPNVSGTVTRSTSGLTTAVVTRPLLMADGTDDYVQLPAGVTPTFTATTGAYTVMLINRVHNLAGAATFSRAWSSEGGGSNTGSQITLDSTNARYLVGVGGSVTAVNAASPAAFTAVTQLHAVALIYSTGTVAAYSTTTGLTGTTSTTGVGTVTHTAPRLWTRGFTVSDVADMETYAVVAWNRALTATELDTASAYLLGTYA